MEANFVNSYETGTPLKIYTYPHSVLSKVAAPVSTFNQELIELGHNMLHTMYHAPGIGLAAPQIGQSIRLFVVDIDYKREQIVNADGEEEEILSGFNPRIFINPQITTLEDEKILYEEGCLSLPGIYEEVSRPRKIQIDYQDIHGHDQSETFEDIAAICIQHENDHLNGTVFIDHLSLLKKNFIKKKIIKQRH